MNYPIPRPKKTEFFGGRISATFEFDYPTSTFLGATEVFREYAERAFGSVKAPTKIQTALVEGLGDGYRISIKESVVVSASSKLGMNYALSTLLQLTEVRKEGAFFPKCEITDFPDSSWRGIMIDLARCFHEIEYLYAVADLCWFYKINRLGLHLTDDQAIRFPLLCLPNAVSEEHYTKEELQGLVRYCADRGVTIVPEIDTPGHFRAFNLAYPELFGTVMKENSEDTTAQSNTVSGIMRAEEQTFVVIEQVFREVAQLFCDSPWIHIGGDEAQINQWEKCDATMRYCKEKGLSDIHELYGHCVARISQMIIDMDRIPVVWEGFGEKTNAMIPKKTLVFSWESYYQTAPSLLKGGFNIINASWQPLYIVAPIKKWPTEHILDWEKNRFEHWWEKSEASKAPIVTEKSPAILGGQICVWGDRMQPGNAFAPHSEMLKEEFSNIEDRLPALAEKTWSCYQAVDKEKFICDMRRLQTVFKSLLKR